MSIEIYIFIKFCHLIVTCLVIHVFSISNVSIDVWFFLNKSHYLSNSTLCVSINMQFFVCLFLRAIFVCVKCQNLQIFCKNCTLLICYNVSVVCSKSNELPLINST